MKVFFNISNLTNKIMISILIITVFFGINFFTLFDEYDDSNPSFIEILRYTISTHIGSSLPFQPKSDRAKITNICQMLISYFILFM